jgi:hypothetical protein
LSGSLASPARWTRQTVLTTISNYRPVAIRTLGDSPSGRRARALTPIVCHGVRRPVTLLIVVLALALCEGARANTLIGPLAAEARVRAWAGIAVLSIRDPGGGYRLATQQGREAPRPLAGIAPTSHPFDANIGPGPSGSPVIVFVRCGTNRRCGLKRTTLAGNVETPIRALAGVGRLDHAPAVWGNRLAFARPAPHGSDWVYVVPLEAGKRARHIRVRGAPRPECVSPARGCRAALVHPAVTELSLRGSTLAEDVNLGLVEDNEMCPRTEVRVIDLDSRRGHRVRQPYCGEGGQTLLGVSLTATHLIFASICPGDRGLCGHTKTLVYRYGLRDHRIEAAPEPDLLTGIAAEDDDHLVEVTAPESDSEEDCTHHSPATHPLCQLVRVGPIRFRPARYLRRL